MPETLPYISAPGYITSILKKVQPAQTPEKFDAKFLSEKLLIKGGGYRTFIPFAKRIGLLTPDGAPTDLYKQFRVQGHSSPAMARAIRTGYKALFESNEKAHQLPPDQLKALIIQVTGKEDSSSAVSQILLCFNKLKEWAKFDGEAAQDEPLDQLNERDAGAQKTMRRRMNISYTINLNLPETTNAAVFNAIFKALKEHMLQEDQE